MPRTVFWWLPAVLLLLPYLQLHAPEPAHAAHPDPYVLQRSFHRAAGEFDVPEPLLLAVSYALTRWEEHAGAPSTSGGYGPMHLTHVDRILDVSGRDGRKVGWKSVRRDAGLHTLDTAAHLLHLPLRALELDPGQNVRGGAALLASAAERTTGNRPRHLTDWYGAVAAYVSSRSAPVALAFANAVYATLQSGAARRTADGQIVQVAAHNVIPNKETATPLHLRSGGTGGAECPAGISCNVVPAAYRVNNANDPTDYGNYDAANRPHDGLAIRYIVIHDTEGPYASALTEFEDSSTYASANYVIRASDGLVTQLVPNRDIAWHAANYFVNMHAIGIEHEGIAIDGATWFSEEVYRTSALLVRYLAHRYHIPLDRAHIIGHDEVPGATPQGQTQQHWDPGPYWDWAHYMDLLGAPLGASGPRKDENGPVLTISPDFATNQPPVTYCYAAGDCRSVPSQGANFVYLHVAPSFSSPLLADPALHGSGGGTTEANDWGDKAVTGQRFYRVAKQGAWDQIDYAGRTAWLYNPDSAPTATNGSGMVVTPRTGLASIPVYGLPYPEPSAYPHDIHPPSVTPLQYRIPAGQQYVAADLVRADYYWTPTQRQHRLITAKTSYYEISFNHRFAFVRESDVNVVQM